MKNLKDIRDKIAALQFQQNAINSQTRSRDEVEIMLATTLTQFEVTAAANMARTVAQLAAGQPATLFTLTGQTAHGPVSFDLGPMFTSLLGTAAMLKAMQAALKSVPEGMAPKAKTEALTALSCELDTLQTDEEKLVRDSELSGVPIPRRTGAAPSYVLAK